MNKFGRITSVVDNLFFLRNSLAYGRQIYFYRLKLALGKLPALQMYKCLWYIIEQAFWSERGGLGNMQPYGVNQLEKNVSGVLREQGTPGPQELFIWCRTTIRALLLINSGMAPLKPYFTGQEIPPRKTSDHLSEMYPNRRYRERRKDRAPRHVL